jgi:hypothetical protein
MVALLLRFDVALLSHDGQPDAALRSDLACLNCARSIGDEPMAISQLVRIAVASMTVAGLERILAQGEPSPDRLAAFQRGLEQEAAEPVLLYMARGERAGQHRLFQGMIDGTARLSQVGGPSAGPLDRWEDAQGARMATRAMPRMLRHMTEFVEAAKLPDDQQPARLQQIDPGLDHERPEDILLGLLMPAFDRIAGSSQRHKAVVRCAVVAVAAERFRQARGRWPDSIAELVPQFLAAVPLDPFDGKPLRWRTAPGGAMVYSVGMDGVDDGGKLDPKRMAQTGFDLGFRLWDASARRQTPEPLPPPRDDPDGEP